MRHVGEVYRRPEFGPATVKLGDPIKSEPTVAVARRSRYVDVSNPSLAVDCPRCGLKTARFMDLCRNCGYKLWPSSVMASAAFKVWRNADPARARASRFDMDLPPPPIDDTVDFNARAHQLGIHLFPSSNYPFVITVGVLFGALGLIPFPSVARIVLGVIGGIILLYGIIGWVLVEDVRMYPTDRPETNGEVHH
jgi:hypothetical protein